MSRRGSAGSLVAVAACAALATAAAQKPGSHAYVQASRAALRSQPSPTAAVVEYLTTNTDVEIQERTGEWCGVRGDTARGFMACSMLGGAKLTIQAIDARLKDPSLSPRDRLDWNARAFWVSPSLVRLERVAYQMEETLLSSKAKEAEVMTEPPPRPRNGEFDAMKKRLEKGVIASERPSPGVTVEGAEPLGRAMKRAALPEIRSSFFRENEPLRAIALRPFTLESAGDGGAALADALSAAYGVSFRVRVVRPMRFASFGTDGVWDVSDVGVTFDKDVTINGVTGTGAPTSLALTSLVAHLGTYGCMRSSLTMGPRRASPGWRSAVVAWVGKSAPGKATVVSRRVGGSGKYDKLVIETVDLDGDGVPDFSLWAGLAPPTVDADTFWKAVFGNVGGKWELLAFNQEPDCT